MGSLRRRTQPPQEQPVEEGFPSWGANSTGGGVRHGGWGGAGLGVWGRGPDGDSSDECREQLEDPGEATARANSTYFAREWALHASVRQPVPCLGGRTV